MPNYKLNIRFTESDLETIYKAGESIILVKHTAGKADSQVAGVTFKLLMNNTQE